MGTITKEIEVEIDDEDIESYIEALNSMEKAELIGALEEDLDDDHAELHAADLISSLSVGELVKQVKRVLGLGPNPNGGWSADERAELALCLWETVMPIVETIRAEKTEQGGDDEKPAA